MMLKTVFKEVCPFQTNSTLNKLFNGRNVYSLILCSKIHMTSHQLAKCELTYKRYPVKRGKFSKINNEHLSFFEGLLGNRMTTGLDELEGYNTDFLGIVRGESSLLLRPKTTEEISKILSYCNANTLAVCPQGGNTGLVGGSVPVFDEVILSTSLMNKVESVDEITGAMVCQAGCVLEKLNHHLSDYGFMMPLDLGAKGSCQIGGNVSTNAGGLRYLRYGSLHGSVLGVEAVLASGEIIDCLTTLKKDNTGYDLKHLFIGSEGTLGVVSKVSIQCAPKPASVSLAFLGLKSFDDVLKTFKMSKSKLGEVLSACEFMDSSSLNVVTENLKLSSPLEAYPFYMIIETSGSDSTHDEEKLTRFLEEVTSSGAVADGTVLTEPSRMLNIWGIRERIAEALLHDGYVFKYDISLPLPVLYKIVEDMNSLLGDDVVRCCGYGHIGDGNLHLNITVKEYAQEIANRIEPKIYEETAKYNGSVSAEHGLGFKKRNCMGYTKSPSAIAVMKQLKTLFDPKGILNPYKVLPEDS